ncbi:hypothetical protein PsYK624_155120 [Phanerochaete sordida]|uniref:DUF6535 domain-containing protein n=1 Tax=Phanerochaete sordida TaxID=48140 RepID=A0A9P3GPE7_9APHY|nr:hypothetical protein PsYK624_155120 [Phanerochaete sordida]
MIPKRRTSRTADDSAENAPSPPEARTSDIWQAMVGSVRDVDVQKVMNTKEDIDTLLVFAGLFSAVVTTFVVDSYNSLTPDNTDKLVLLMRQSLAQNYTFVDGILRPVVPFPGDPQFEAPLWALRVNGLWFASLIVCLSAASFGMLVKQWLIEYMAMEWISPEERLRARQYRYAGVKAWRVFEIAAMLPLLLHLSLGLFFLGLCFYTAAANKTVGRSTLPLVMGWAFFALLTVFAPLASPRCPYKITLLKTALRMGRIYVACHLKKLLDTLLLPLFSAVMWTWLAPVKMLIVLGRQIDQANDMRLERKTSYHYTRHHHRFLYLPIDALVFVSYFLAFRLPYLLASLYFQADTSDEEDYLMRQPYETHELLLSVDKAIFNDGPVLENMVNVLKQTQAPPQPVVTFVLECIRLRVGEASYARWAPLHADGPIRGLPDLSTLSEGAWAVLVNLIVETLQSHLTGTEKSGCWATVAVVLVFSWSPRPLPPTARTLVADPAVRASMLQILRECIHDWPKQDFVDVVGIFLTAQRRSAERMSYTTWDHLLLLDQPISSAIQQPLIQVLLRSINVLEGAVTTHAHLLLVFVLHTTLPIDTRFSYPSDYELPPSYYNGGSATTLATVLARLPKGHADISQPLAAAVHGSPDLLMSALQFYKAVSFADPLPHTPLWEHINAMKSSRLAEPVMRDLWSFVLLCAHPATSDDGGDYLWTSDFIKLCLVLAAPNVPRIFGREDPAGDWRKLVPVFTKTADDGRLVREARSDYSIPSLANRALRRLPHDSADVPQELRDVLERLAHMGGYQDLGPLRVTSPTRSGGDGVLSREYAALPIPPRTMDDSSLLGSAAGQSVALEKHQHADGPSEPFSQGSREGGTEENSGDRYSSKSVLYDDHRAPLDGQVQISDEIDLTASLSSDHAALEGTIRSCGTLSRGVLVNAESVNEIQVARAVSESGNGLQLSRSAMKSAPVSPINIMPIDLEETAGYAYRTPAGQTTVGGTYDQDPAAVPGPEALADRSLSLCEADEVHLPALRDIATPTSSTHDCTTFETFRPAPFVFARNDRNTAREPSTEEQSAEGMSANVISPQRNASETSLPKHIVMEYELAGPCVVEMNAAAVRDGAQNSSHPITVPTREEENHAEQGDSGVGRSSSASPDAPATS